MEFYIEEHATLFALLYRTAVERLGEKGAQASDEGTKQYGLERGARMAKRATADNRINDMLTYTQYGEWVDSKGYSKGSIVCYNPVYTTETQICGWCEAWKKHGLLEYGKNYCRYVDHYLVKGFNPDSKINLTHVLSRGDDCCHFEWLGASFDDEAQYKETRKVKSDLMPKVTKDFLYHTSHLLSAMQRMYLKHLDQEDANYIVNKALEDFSKIFGDEKSSAIIEASKQDFTII